MNDIGGTKDWLMPISVSHLKCCVFVQAERKKNPSCTSCKKNPGAHGNPNKQFQSELMTAQQNQKQIIYKNMQIMTT